ncbi:MAG: CBS domain-containing protein [Candidatus Dormibacteraceae bacterium]
MREVMSTELVTVDPSVSVGEAATVMGLKRVGSVLVMHEGKLIGIFTERDVVRAISQDVGAGRESIRHWMAHKPITVEPVVAVEQALQIMIEKHFRHLPVVENGLLVGIVSIRDLSGAAFGV